MTVIKDVLRSLVSQATAAQVMLGHADEHLESVVQWAGASGVPSEADIKRTLDQLDEAAQDVTLVRAHLETVRMQVLRLQYMASQAPYQYDHDLTPDAN